MNGTLFELEQNLIVWLDTAEGVPPEQEQEFLEDLSRTLSQVVQKRDRIAQFIKHLESQSELADREAKRIRERGERFTKAAERLRNYVQRVMESLDVQRLEGATTTFVLRRNPPSVAVLDEAAIPAAFKVIVSETRIDKRGIADALKAGREVPGAQLKHTTGLLLR